MTVELEEKIEGKVLEVHVSGKLAKLDYELFAHRDAFFELRGSRQRRTPWLKRNGHDQASSCSNTAKG